MAIAPLSGECGNSPTPFPDRVRSDGPGRGASGSSLPTYRWGRYWNSSSGPWLMIVFSKTVAGRSEGINRFHDQCRALDQIQGRPL